MMKLLIFGGTTEGRELTEYLSGKNADSKSDIFDVTLSVATEYAKKFLDGSSMKILVGRLETEDIEELVEKERYDYVVDATHPYAVEVSKNIKKSLKLLTEKGFDYETKYIRLLRKKSDLSGCIVLGSIAEACSKCDCGNVLASTGSKQINEYSELENFSDRVYARVLPTDKSIKLCIDAGLDDSHIIVNTGAVSYEDNIEVIKKYNIKNIITKDGGVKGGFYEKRDAAIDSGINIIVVDRPAENGMTYEEVISLLSD